VLYFEGCEKDACPCSVMCLDWYEVSQTNTLASQAEISNQDGKNIFMTLKLKIKYRFFSSHLKHRLTIWKNGGRRHQTKNHNMSLFINCLINYFIQKRTSQNFQHKGKQNDMQTQYLT
jgi:hypothetical protein